MLKESDLPAPDALIDYEDGSFGPVMLHYAIEGMSVKLVAAEHGFDVCYREPDHDWEMDEPITLQEWTPPEIEGWKLSGKCDTEEGPMALYLRKKQEQKYDLFNDIYRPDLAFDIQC